MLWSYIFSFVLDYETLEVKKYVDIEEKINEFYADCFALLMERDAYYLAATSFIENTLDTNTFPKDFLRILNLYAMGKSQEIAEAVYGYGVRIAYEMDSVKETNEWFFYNVLTDFNYDEIHRDIPIKNPDADGKLQSAYSIEELKK